MKLQLLAQKAKGGGALTDEEYDREMRQFTADAIASASDAELEQWLEARSAMKTERS